MSVLTADKLDLTQTASVDGFDVQPTWMRCKPLSRTCIPHPSMRALAHLLLQYLVLHLQLPEPCQPKLLLHDRMPVDRLPLAVRCLALTVEVNPGHIHCVQSEPKGVESELGGICGGGRSRSRRRKHSHPPRRGNCLDAAWQAGPHGRIVHSTVGREVRRHEVAGELRVHSGRKTRWAPLPRPV